jgi:hypothetical protein
MYKSVNKNYQNSVISFYRNIVRENVVCDEGPFSLELDEGIKVLNVFNAQSLSFI